jgi:hypothetical protein
MQFRESDPLVMLAGSMLTVSAIILVAVGIVIAHFWR